MTPRRRYIEWRPLGNDKPGKSNASSHGQVSYQSIASTREEIAAKAKAAYADHQFTDPAPGSFALMLSKEGYLLGADGPWHPHIMPFIAYDQMSTWAAGLKGSPIDGPSSISYYRTYEPVTLAIPVTYWSDGSLGPMIHRN